MSHMLPLWNRLTRLRRTKWIKSPSSLKGYTRISLCNKHFIWFSRKVKNTFCWFLYETGTFLNVWTLLTVKQIHSCFHGSLMSSSSSAFVFLSCCLLWFYFWPLFLPEKLVSSSSACHPQRKLLCLVQSAAGSSSGFWDCPSTLTVLPVRAARWAGTRFCPRPTPSHLRVNRKLH